MVTIIIVGSMAKGQHSIFRQIDCRQVVLVVWMNYSVTINYFDLEMAIFQVSIEVDYWTTIVGDCCSFRKAVVIRMCSAVVDSTFMLATWMVSATMSIIMAIIMAIYMDSIVWMSY